MTDQEKEVTPVRSNSPELAAMSLPKLKEVVLLAEVTWF